MQSTLGLHAHRAGARRMTNADWNVHVRAANAIIDRVQRANDERAPLGKGRAIPLAYRVRFRAERQRIIRDGKAAAARGDQAARAKLVAAYRRNAKDRAKNAQILRAHDTFVAETRKLSLYQRMAVPTADMVLPWMAAMLATASSPEDEARVYAEVADMARDIALGGDVTIADEASDIDAIEARRLKSERFYAKATLEVEDDFGRTRRVPNPATKEGRELIAMREAKADARYEDWSSERAYGERTTLATRFAIEQAGQSGLRSVSPPEYTTARTAPVMMGSQPVDTAPGWLLIAAERRVVQRPGVLRWLLDDGIVERAHQLAAEVGFEPEREDREPVYGSAAGRPMAADPFDTAPEPRPRERTRRPAHGTHRLRQMGTIPSSAGLASRMANAAKREHTEPRRVLAYIGAAMEA